MGHCSSQHAIGLVQTLHPDITHSWPGVKNQSSIFVKTQHSTGDRSKMSARHVKSTHLQQVLRRSKTSLSGDQSDGKALAQFRVRMQFPEFQTLARSQQALCQSWWWCCCWWCWHAEHPVSMCTSHAHNTVTLSETQQKGGKPNRSKKIKRPWSLGKLINKSSHLQSQGFNKSLLTFSKSSPDHK